MNAETFSGAQERASCFREFEHIISGYRITTDELDGAGLLAMFRKSGFLYPQKSRFLEENLGLLVSNWDQALKKTPLWGDNLFTVLVCSDGRDAWAAITLWRTAENTYAIQSLVSNGRDPHVTRAVIIAAYLHLLDIGAEFRTGWFRPQHPVTSDFVQRMAADHAHTSVVALDYCPYQLRTQTHYPDIDVVPFEGPLPAELFRLISKARGPLFADAEQLVGDDPQGARLDEAWRRHDLFRYQVPLVAFAGSNPVGIALCHRSSFGLNASLLENKCDLILDLDTGAATLRRAVSSLLDSACDVYRDFPTAPVPVMSDPAITAELHDLGLQPARQYAEIVTARGGFLHACHAIRASYDDRTTRRRQES